MIKTNIDTRVKYHLFLSNFNETWFFSDRLSRNTQISNCMQIRPVGAELYHADGQTDMTKPVVDFRNF